MREDLEQHLGRHISLRTTHGLAYHGVLLSVNNSGVIIGTGPNKAPQGVLYENIQSFASMGEPKTKGSPPAHLTVYIVAESPEDVLVSTLWQDKTAAKKVLAANPRYKMYQTFITIDTSTIEEV